MADFEDAAPDKRITDAQSQNSASDAPILKGKKRGVHIFRPDRMVDSVTEVPPAELKIRGIKGLIVDLDNTLVLWQQEEITDEIMAWLTELQKMDIKLCVLSNSVLSMRSVRIAERLGIANVRQARKPAKSGFVRAMQAMGTTPENTAIVGDQMFTDIWGGNRAGIYTIMVAPIHHREFLYTKYVSRPPERLLLRYFKRRGHL